MLIVANMVIQTDIWQYIGELRIDTFLAIYFDGLM